MRIRLPTQISTTASGFAALATLHDALRRFSNRTIQLDCSDLGWLDGNMAAALGTVVKLAELNGNKISFERMAPNVVRVLSKNGFLGSNEADIFRTTIPFKTFSVKEEVLFAEYTEKNLKGHDIPDMSPQLRDKFLEGLDEIFANASVHSRTPLGVFSCGQAYPKANRIRFTIADCGIGISQCLREARSIIKEADDAIHWAMTEGSTTKTGDVPGGLGLKILREFIDTNGGEIVIASHNGFWSSRKRVVTRRRFLKPYPGTVVSIQINTADKNSYYLAEEINPNKIFE